MIVQAIIAVGVPSDAHKTHHNYVFGKDGGLPWDNVPGDLKHFREFTGEYPMIMGAATFKSLPKKLPGRSHIVLSRGGSDVLSKDGHSPEAIVRNLDDAISIASDMAECCTIIGGAGIVLDALRGGYVDKLSLTKFVMHQTLDEIGADVVIDSGELDQAMSGSFTYSMWWAGRYVMYTRRQILPDHKQVEEIWSCTYEAVP